MTNPLALVVPPNASSRMRLHPSRWLLVGSALALAACTSVPLPEWPAAGTTRTGAPTAATAPSGPAPAPTASTSPVVQTSVDPLPYSHAIASLFPTPSQRYQTPGLSDGRSTFTTNTQLAQLLRDLPRHSEQGHHLTVLEAGNSQNGQQLYAVLAAHSADLSPAALDNTRRPTVMIVAGQQGNAPASTEAVLALLQELDSGGLLPPMLAKINLLLVPRANPDGFDAKSSSTANGTDLRRDHLQLNTPEARALAQLMNRYRPAIVVDAGEFPALQPTLERFAAVRANDVGVQYAHTANTHEFITKATREWFYQPLLQRLAQAELRVDALANPTGSDASAGFAMDTPAPTTLTNIATLKNALGLIVDSRGSDLGSTHIQRRVHSHVQALLSVLDSASQHAADLYKIQSFAARDTASKACQGNLAVQVQPMAQQRKITLIDSASAQLTEHTVAWQSALELTQPQLRSRPCGYWLAAEARNTAAQLDQLGVQVQHVAEITPLVADGYQAGSNGAAISVQRALIDATPGSYYVSMNQPQAHLVSAVLEPDTAYSSYAQGILSNLSHLARVVTPAPLVFADD